MRQVAIDDRGAYYYTDTGEDAYIAFEGNSPYDIYTGEDVILVRMSGKGELIEDISGDVKDVLVAIFGNSNQIPPARSVPPQSIPPVLATPRSVASNVQRSNLQPEKSGGLFGGEVKIKAEYALLIIGGFILFSLGKSKGR